MYDESLLSWGYNAHTKSATLLASLLADQSCGGGSGAERVLDRVLDTGCGTGMSGEALQRAGFAPSAGIDISAVSLEYIRRTKPGVYDGLEVVDLDALASKPLPFGSDSFCGVSCVGVLSYVHNFETLFTEWVRASRIYLEYLPPPRCCPLPC